MIKFIFKLIEVIIYVAIIILFFFLTFRMMDYHAEYHYERGILSNQVRNVEIFKNQRAEIRKLEIINYNLKKQLKESLKIVKEKSLTKEDIDDKQ